MTTHYRLSTTSNVTAHVFMRADRSVKPNHFSALRTEVAVLAVLCAIREIDTAGSPLCSHSSCSCELLIHVSVAWIIIKIKFHKYKYTYFITKYRMKKVSRRFRPNNSNLWLFHYTSVRNTLPSRPNSAPISHCAHPQVTRHSVHQLNSVFELCERIGLEHSNRTFSTYPFRFNRRLNNMWRTEYA